MLSLRRVLPLVPVVLLAALTVVGCSKSSSGGSAATTAPATTAATSSTTGGVVLGSVVPDRAPELGGTSISVQGQGFTAGAQVEFGATPATRVTVTSATELTCELPPHSPGTVDVVVTLSSGDTTRLAGGFTFDASLGSGSTTIVTNSVMTSVAYLADDAREGRNAGFAGGRAAGDWLAAQCQSIGLLPAGDNGTYFQSFTAAGLAARKVIATLPGRSFGEMVVIGAHYDHVGIQNGQVYNGADDNASGCAALLEIARAFAADPQCRRRVVFCWFDAEEQGLVGSNAFVSSPTVGDTAVVMLNMDMIGRLGTQPLTVYGSGTGDLFLGWIQNANASLNLSLDLTTTMITNSDHGPFYTQGTPVLFPFTGLHADYHQPTDDADLLNYDGIARIAQLIYAIARQAAESPVAPVFSTVP